MTFFPIFYFNPTSASLSKTFTYISFIPSMLPLEGTTEAVKSL